MGKPMTIPLGLGGQWSSGDAGSQPDGTTRLLQNILPRPNRFPSRAPFVYDGLMSVNGLANFDDQTNKAERLVAIDTTHHVYTKSATAGSETWGSANATTISGTRLSSSANYRNKTYMMFDNGTGGLPSAAAVYDGSNLSTAPFTSAIVARCAVVFDERIYLSYPRLTFTVQVIGSTAANAPYDFTSGHGWGLTNITAANVVVDGGTVCRLYLTSTTASSFAYTAAAVPSSGFGAIGVPPSDSPTSVAWRFSARNQSATFEMPVTLTLRIGNFWIAFTNFSVGDIISDGTNIQRCVTAGATDATTPSWSSTLGATTTDGTVTWRCEGSDVIRSVESYLPTSETTTLPTVITVRGNVPPSTNTVLVKPHGLFANTLTPTVTLGAVDMSFKDGLTDGDPAKSNWGHQFTLGDFEYPFFNRESSLTTTVDLEEEIWTEIGQPSIISAANTQKLREHPGVPTAACAIGNRKLTFKRSAFWQFQSTGDAEIPIRRERLNANVGCVGPLALDTWNDTAFFIGENEIFSYSVGGDPTPLCGDGMREEIMRRGSSWVESQSTYNRPILRIDQSKLIVWVYTQKGKLYAYDLRTKSWSTHLVGDGTFEIDCMEWNRNTGNLYVSFGGHGLTRMEYTSIARDTIDNTATEHDVDCTVIFKPIELYSPPRYDYCLQQIRFLHGTTESQTGQTTTAAYSFDQGRTFARSTTVTLNPLSVNGEFVPLRFPARQGRATITAKLSHVGKTGEVTDTTTGTVQSAWSLSSRAYADVIVRREERVQSNPTQGAHNLS